jgi:hypothetical protein
MRFPLPRSWAAVGAVLGVVATLWATLIGQTIPELLADDDAALNGFRSDVDAICASAEDRLGSNRSASPERLRDVQAQFAAILPPAQYRDEYEDLERAWSEIVNVAGSLSTKPPPPKRASPGQGFLDADGDGIPNEQEFSVTPAGFRAGVEFQANAALMQLRACRRFATVTETLISRPG